MSCNIRTVKHFGSVFGSCTNCIKYKLSTAKRAKPLTVKVPHFELSKETKNPVRDSRRVNDWRV